MKFGVVFFLAFSLSVFGCSSSKQTIITDVAVSADSSTAENPIVVSFEQTGCYGSCPIHKMVIYQDGTAIYIAQRHTKLEGAFSYTFSNTEVEKMLNKATDLQFFDAEKEYTLPISDLPTTIIFIQYGNKKQQVTAYANYPENIQTFIKYLYDITQETDWKKTQLK